MRAPRGTILISDLQKFEGIENGVYNAVMVYHNRLNIHVYSKNNRTYKLQFSSPEEAKAWREAICSHIT